MMGFGLVQDLSCEVCEEDFNILLVFREYDQPAYPLGLWDNGDIGTGMGLRDGGGTAICGGICQDFYVMA